jgi:MFS family permease
VLGWSALRTGLTFIATAGTAILWAGLAQWLTTRIGPKIVLMVGFVSMITGLAWYTQIPVHASYWSNLLPGYLLVGFALPFTFIPVSIAALAGVEGHEAGLASGLFNTAQQIGVAVTSSVSISHFDALTKVGENFPQAFTAGSRWAFWVTVGIGVAGLIATAILIRPEQIAEVEEQTAVA